MSEKITATAAKRLEARIGKVLSHHQNRGGFSTALAYIPDDATEQEHGSLYFVIDIGSPSPLSGDIAYNLIDIVKDEFYADLTLSPSQSFERALKAANEELEAIYKSGEKDWVGKFNAIIAAVVGRDVYIVQRGTAEVHLVRGGHMTNLSRGMYTPGETYRPEETLVNLLEGEIELADKMLFSTSELFYYISIEKLKRMIEGNSPASAAKKLATLLEQEEAINRTSVLVSEFNLPELIAQEEDTEPTENWIGEPTKAESRRNLPTDTAKLDKTKTISEALEDEVVAVPAPQVSTRNYQTDEDEPEMEEEKSRLPQIDMEAGINFAKESFGNIKKNINFGDYKGKLNIDGSKFKGVGAIAWKVVKAIGIVLSGVFGSVITLATNFVRNMKRRPNGNKILLGIGIGLVVLIVGLSTVASASYSGRVGVRKAQQSIALAEQKRDEAQAALIYQDTAKARGLLAEAFAAAQAATGNAKVKSEADVLIADLQKQLDSINGVKRFLDIQPVADFASLSSQLGDGKQAKIGQASILEGNIYAVDPDNNKIYRYKPASGELAILNSLVSSDKKLKLIAPFSPKEVEFYTTPPNMYALNLDNNSLAGKALDTGNWSNAENIIAYTNKLYFLDPANNQIWKYQTAPEGFTPIAPYFEVNAGIDLAGAMDFAIDGSVYVLQPNNVIKKYTGGVLATDFKLQDVPQPYAALGNVTQIYADTGTKLYLLDSANKRVVVYNPDGTYVSQFVFESIDSATNLHVDEAGKFIYLTNGTQAYRLPIG
jgi:hypothetical protein